MYTLTTNSYDYNSFYDSTDLRGVDDKNTPRPWNLQALVIKNSYKEYNMLDIGCGTAFKLIPLAPYFKTIVGIDPSESMRKAAIEKIGLSSIKNITILDNDANNISNLNMKFDLITSMVAKFNIQELHRCITSNGKIIIEYIGCQDKIQFKKYFGKDNQGWRGQLIDETPESYIDNFKNMFSKFFETVRIENGYWNTFYSKEGLIKLLNNTPTIRNFSEKDHKILDHAINELITPHGIKLQQNRILIYAERPKIF